MIVYDNRSHVAIIFRYSGSVLPKCLPIGIVTLSIGTALAILRRLEKTKDVFGSNMYIDDPFAVQVMSIVTGYLVVVRMNMALSRWMDGIGEIQLMISKWTDAYTCINGFWSGKPGPNSIQDRILFARIRIAHYFALMSCIAFATLRSGFEADIDHIPIKAMFPYGNSASGKKERLTKNRSTIYEGNSPELSPQLNAGNRNPAMSPLSRSRSSLAIVKNVEEEVGALDLSVLHAPTPEEVALLERTSDKVAALSLWIIQTTIIEVRAGTLDAPPPILSRIYQEMSNAMLGFHQAHKVAMVPFPFPFAQMVNYILVILYLVLPFYIDVFSRSLLMTPLVSFLLPMALGCLNRIAVELEEPFGTDRNDVDIEERHEAFIALVDDQLKNPTTPPMQANHEMEHAILMGYRRKTPPDYSAHGVESAFLSGMRRGPSRHRMLQPNPVA